MSNQTMQLTQEQVDAVYLAVSAARDSIQDDMRLALFAGLVEVYKQQTKTSEAYRLILQMLKPTDQARADRYE
jgi:hypothetical protein